MDVDNSIVQANQRKGRTGRTCDGIVYRLVPRNHFLKLEKFETPAMQLLSLRKQVLMILCASSKALNDPAGFPNLIVPTYDRRDCKAYLLSGHEVDEDSFCFIRGSE